jgi:hypothetical protein
LPQAQIIVDHFHVIKKRCEHGTPRPSERPHRYGFLFSFETAWRTLQGLEVMNMMRKGQMQGVTKGNVRGQVETVAKLFGVAA